MNIDFFSIPSFDRAFILARKSNKTLPGSVRDNLSDKEEERLLEIIEGFEKDPTDLKAKNKDYDELMKLFYKGIGLDEKGKGTITKENQRAAFELSALISDAILQDQQNIGKTYSDNKLNEALKLQNKFRKALEGTNFKRLLSARGSSYTELSEGQKEYQTEKITSYLAENKKDFKDIFEKLSKGEKLNEDQQRKLKNLTKLSGTGINGQNILNDILHTFKEFQGYSFTHVNLMKMKKTFGKLLEQAVHENINPNDNWERIKPKSNKDDDDGSSYVDDSDRSSSRSGRDREISELLRKILARLDGINPGNNNRYNNTNRGNGRNSNNCNCGNTNNGNNGGNSAIPSWLQALGFGITNIGLPLVNLFGLGNNNQNGGCYSPPPCYAGGSPSPCLPIPYYVGGNTWPWGGANGINGQYGASNNAIPSSVSSNPYSTASAYNNTPVNVNVNVRVNPVFNNNPYMVSNSSALSSSNAYNLRRGFGIS
ncbi:MAG: hypothetical protein EBR67_00950 [Proteobacteria bacterium]|nr:hypothetical protein [Pseudomonadota bacterium]